MARILFFSVVCVWLGGCAHEPRPYDDPVAVMLDRRADERHRRRAIHQLQGQPPTDPAYRASLHRLVWEPGHPDWLRRYAMDRLVERDEVGLRAEAARNIHRIDRWQTLEYLLSLAVRGKWTDFTPVVVSHYARISRVVADADRPEKAAILALNRSKTVEKVAFEVFWGTFRGDDRADGHDDAGGDGIPMSQRVAAWELLNRLVDRPNLTDWLDRVPGNVPGSVPGAIPGGDPLIGDLRAAWDQLHVWPVNREGVLWLTFLRSPDQRGFWRRASAVVANLSDEQRRGLALRHLPVLLRLNEQVLAMDRSALLARVAAGLHGVGSGGGGDRDRLAAWVGRLTWPDLAVIDLLQGCLTDRALIGELFAQADADLADTSTEHGGVLDVRPGGGWVARRYEPVVRRHDRVFYPPQAMVTGLYTAVAHYHFHAQQYDNTQYAGPGLGDRRLADRMNFTGLVLTFLDRDHLDVAYYQPGGVVIGLGVIRR